MTLMSEKIGQNATRRCDARCYDAKRDHCTCLCGGLNHGAGLKQAMTNVRETFLPVLEKRGIDLGKKMGRIIADEQQQMTLNI
jgi:hypothetical protein